MRFGFAPFPAAAPGYTPAADARALMAASVASPASRPVAGRQYTGSYAQHERFVVRVPAQWNGSLVVAGTPATRCEFSSDAVWGDFVLANGYAFAASNKCVPYNAILGPAAAVADRHVAYPVPFDSGGLMRTQSALEFGALAPQRVPIEIWNADYRALVVFSRELLARYHRPPRRVYAVGLSNGGAQVRTLLERAPELVDGGVDWAGVYWSPAQSLLDSLPSFLREMPAYIESGFRDRAVVKRLLEQGFPPDIVQDDPAHPSLYAEFYSNMPPFYADVTVFVYALLVDPTATSSFRLPPCSANVRDPARLPGACNGTGLALPENRAAYRPSPQARTAIAAFAHSGDIGKPLVSIAGSSDAFITPEAHAVAYAGAVRRAQRAALHALYVVAGGTHVDAFTAFGYGLQAQAPFAWAAFSKLVRTVEHGAPFATGMHAVDAPAQIA